MDEDYLLSRFGLVPATADLPEIRELIQTLTADENRESNEPLKTLCIQLFSAGDPGDALLIYKAKSSSFDAGFYIDIELTCGAGVEQTKDFLENSGDPDAEQLLNDLKECVSGEDFTPESHLDFYRKYYGI